MSIKSKRNCTYPNFLWSMARSVNAHERLTATAKTTKNQNNKTNPFSYCKGGLEEYQVLGVGSGGTDSKKHSQPAKSVSQRVFELLQHFPECQLTLKEVGEAGEGEGGYKKLHSLPHSCPNSKNKWIPKTMKCEFHKELSEELWKTNGCSQDC